MLLRLQVAKIACLCPSAGSSPAPQSPSELALGLWPRNTDLMVKKGFGLTPLGVECMNLEVFRRPIGAAVFGPNPFSIVYNILSAHATHALNYF